MRDKPFILYDSQIFDMQRFGGISRYFCEIIQRLHLDYDIALYYSINYYLTSHRLVNHRIPLPRFIFRHYRNFWQKQNRTFILRLLQSKKQFIFHPTCYDPYFLHYIGNQPYVVTVHDMIHEIFPHYFSNIEAVLQNKKEIITGAQRIIAISENTKKDIIDILHINPDKIDVIHHGTSMKVFSGKPSLPLPDKFILFVGDRAPYKNFNRFLKAFSIINKEDANLHIVCTGQKFSQEEETLITELNIQNRIVQIKASDKALEELYSRARLFVFPSLYEGFGIPILEAYACRCPVALSNTSCFPEIAGEAGVYFDPYSETSISDAIKEVLYSNELRDNLIRKGSERLKLYSWEKATQLTEETYQKADIAHEPIAINKIK